MGKAIYGMYIVAGNPGTIATPTLTITTYYVLLMNIIKTKSGV